MSYVRRCAVGLFFVFVFSVVLSSGCSDKSSGPSGATGAVDKGQMKDGPKEKQMLKSAMGSPDAQDPTQKDAALGKVKMP